MARKPRDTKFPTHLIESRKKVEKLRIDLSSGNIFPLGKDDSELSVPITSFVDKERKGAEPKIMELFSRNTVSTNVDSWGNLARVDNVVIIDTNTKVLYGKSRSASFFFMLKVKDSGDFFTIEYDQKIYGIEILNAKQDAELIAIYLFIFEFIEKIKIFRPSETWIIVTDTRRDDLIRINRREIPMFSDRYLPEKCKLMYSSRKEGGGIFNKFIKNCNKIANDYLKGIEKMGAPEDIMESVKEIPEVKFIFINSQFNIQLGNTKIPKAPLDVGTARLVVTGDRSQD
jgi:uncharacterized protein YuzE